MPHQKKMWQKNKSAAASVKEVVWWVTRLTHANFFSSILKIFCPYNVLWWRPLTVHGGISLGATFGCPAYGLRTDRWDIPSSGKDTHSPSWKRKIASRVESSTHSYSSLIDNEPQIPKWVGKRCHILWPFA
jgi:hypothetical protein